jgi:hypothetical protein
MTSCCPAANRILLSHTFKEKAGVKRPSSERRRPRERRHNGRQDAHRWVALALVQLLRHERRAKPPIACSQAERSAGARQTAAKADGAIIRTSWQEAKTSGNQAAASWREIGAPPTLLLASRERHKAIPVRHAHRRQRPRIDRIILPDDAVDLQDVRDHRVGLVIGQ